MTVRRFWSALVVFGMSALLPATAMAQEKKPDPPKPPAEKKADEKKPDAKGGMPGMPEMTPEQLAEMEAWMKAAMPGPEHKNLEYMVGKWNVTGKFWDDKAPDQPPQDTKGTMSTEWFNEGRFTKYEYKGEMMGMPFTGWGYSGYDNIEKKYVSIWIDSMGTGIMKNTGSYDAATKTFTFTGEMKDPTGKSIKTRETVKVNSKDEHVMTFYHTGADGKDFKMGELNYQRVK